MYQVTNPQRSNTIARHSMPFLWGAQDASAGQPCVPEIQWIRRSDQRDYCAGYAFVAGHNDTTRYFLGSN